MWFPYRVVVDTPRGVGRRAWLAALGTTLAGGCVASGRDTALRVLAAGSLARTVDRHVRPAFERETGVDVAAEYHGTTALVRMVRDGVRSPDVVVGADASLVRRRLADRTDWDVVFASNALGVGYDASTDLGGRLAAGEPWYRVLPDGAPGDVAVGDPEADPLGYRAVMAVRLAARRHDAPALPARLDRVTATVGDEPRLLLGVESGARPAAVVYRNIAVDHDLPFLRFPPAYSFADPARADLYGAVSYTTDDGVTVRGRPIRYGATVLDDAAMADRARRFVRFLVEYPARLRRAGLVVGETTPRGHGSVPFEL